MDFTMILKHLGDFGTFQKLIFALICIIQLFVGIHMLANVFLMGELKHRCYIPECDNSSTKYYEQFVHFAVPNTVDNYGHVIPSLCNHYTRIEGTDSCEESSFNKSNIVTCNSYVWDRTEFESTTISEFNIVCDESWDEAFSSSFFMMGNLVGSAVFGMISDRYGRKTVIVLASIILLFSSTGTAFASSFQWFSFFRFVTAASVCGLVQAGYILALEFIGTSRRLICSSIMQASFSVGELLLCLSAYYTRKWRTLELSVSIPGVILLLYYWILPESVRWLISKGRYSKAKLTILNAAKWNRVEIPESSFVLDSFAVEDNMKLPKVGPLSLIKTPRLRKWSLNIFLNWMVNTMVYYGLALSAGHLYGDIYMNFSILALVEIPSVLLSTLALLRYGPRRILCLMMVLGGIACGVTILIPSDISWVTVVIAVIGRSAITASFAIIYLYSAEIFPTVLRSTGIGMSSTFGRIGSILAPIILQLGKVYSFLPMLVFSIATIISGLLTLALPETHKKQLPDTIEEAENFGLTKESQLEKVVHAKGHLFSHDSSVQNNYTSEQERLLQKE